MRSRGGTRERRSAGTGADPARRRAQRVSFNRLRCDCVQCVWRYRHHSPWKNWYFPFKLSRNGTENSERIVSRSQFHQRAVYYTIHAAAGTTSRKRAAFDRAQRPPRVAPGFSKLLSAAGRSRDDGGAQSESSSEAESSLLFFAAGAASVTRSG